MTGPRERQLQGEPVTTIVPGPRRRMFRQITLGARLAEFVWRWARRLIFYPSPAPFHAWRRWVLRLFGANIHPSVMIHRSVQVFHPWNLTLEQGVVLLHSVVLDCHAPILIGAGTRISQLSHLCTATHAYDQCQMPIVGQPISIGSRCWLAADVFVGCGVSIGDGSVVGARSSVFKDVPSGVVMAGTPARMIHQVPRDVCVPDAS